LYAGRSVTTTNAKLHRSTVEQNPAGLTTRVTDDAGGVIEHLYDAMGRLLQTFTEEEVEGKRTRLVTSFEYDALGRKTKMTDPSLGTWEYGYTVFGELKWQRDAKGTVVTFQYDALGRKLEQKAQVADANASPGTLRTVERTQWIYDAFAEGQPVAWNGALLCTKFFWTDAAPKWTERVTALDALGRVLSTSRSFEGKTFVTAGTYDAYGRPETYRYPSGFETRTMYAPQGHLIEALQSGLRSWEVEKMDAEGRVIREKPGNGLVSTCTFDPRKTEVCPLGAR
jgi:YD repeat-containing protein